MKGRLALAVVTLMVVTLVGSACAPAAAPAPTQAPAAPAKAAEPAKAVEPAKAAEPAKPAGEATKPPAPAATKAPEAAKPAAAAPKQPVEIRFGGAPAGDEGMYLLQAKPELAPNLGKAYTLNYTPFRSNDDRFTAFQAGEIDAPEVAAPTAIFAKLQGMPIKVVASVSVESVRGFKSSFYVRADSDIKSISDLKGKTIGILAYKSATELWARHALLQKGLNPERDVKLVTLSAPAMGNSLRTNKVDAAILIGGIFVAEEESKPGIRKLFDTKDVFPFDEELMLMSFRDEFLKKNPEAVKAFLSDYLAAVKYYEANMAEAKKLLLDKKLVQAQLDLYVKAQEWYRRPDGRVDVSSMEKLQDMMIEAGWIEKDKKLKMDDLIDLSYLPGR